MIQDVITLLFIAFALACFSIMLDFGLGYPNGLVPEDYGEGQMISNKELLFFWTFYLSIGALKKYNSEKYNTLLKERNDYMSNSPQSFIVDQDGYERHIVRSGRAYFTWQKAVGMCIYCTNFWLCVLACIFLACFFNLSTLPNYFLLCIPAISHLLIKKIKT